jgi:hypothetical protein
LGINDGGEDPAFPPGRDSTFTEGSTPEVKVPGGTGEDERLIDDGDAAGAAGGPVLTCAEISGVQ